jgi:glutathione peroxidase-family protein
MRKLFLSLAVLALVASPALAGQYNKAVSVGEKAPVFASIPATTKAGNDLSLSLNDFKDPVVVVVFLANHCPVVQAYEDRLIDFTKDYMDKGVKVVGLCVNDLDSDRLPQIKSYMKEKKSNYVYGYDETQEIGHNYGATNTPQFFVLDNTRTIRYMGQMDDSQNEARVSKTYLRDAVDAVLKGEDPKNPSFITETQPRGCSVKYTK